MVRCCSIRPLFLGACILACKVARDGEPKLSEVHERLADVLNALQYRQLVLIEHQMLEVLRWRISIDRNYQVFADEIFHAASQALCSFMRSATTCLGP